MMRQYGEQITLTLIDLTMPGMTGDELADTLLAQYPTLRIILTSGFHSKKCRPIYVPPARSRSWPNHLP